MIREYGLCPPPLDRLIPDCFRPPFTRPPGAAFSDTEGNCRQGGIYVKFFQMVLLAEKTEHSRTIQKKKRVTQGDCDVVSPLQIYM